MTPWASARERRGHHRSRRDRSRGPRQQLPRSWSTALHGPTLTAPKHRPSEAHRVNADGRRQRRDGGRRSAGAWIVQISTDYVFDGNKRSPYVESDAPSPLSSYGSSKLAGEREVVARCPDTHTIVRTSWLFGQRPVLSGDDHAPGRRARRADGRRRPGRLPHVHRSSGRGSGRADRRTRAASGSRAHGCRGVVLVVRVRARGARVRRRSV